MMQKTANPSITRATKRAITMPINRLEGRGKIELFLDDQGRAIDVFWQAQQNEVERYRIGRPAEEMSRIVSNICGVCPSAHHMAATRALDDLDSVRTPSCRTPHS